MGALPNTGIGITPIMCVCEGGIWLLRAMRFKLELSHVIPGRRKEEEEEEGDDAAAAVVGCKMIFNQHKLM